MHVHIVLCCGVNRVLFTNTLSEYWCHIYLFTKFHTSMHLGKQLHKHAHSHCSLLWCEQGIVYQQVIRKLVSYLPVYQVSYTQTFRVRELHKYACSHCFFVVVRIGLSFTNKLLERWCHTINPYLFTKFLTYIHAFRYESHTNIHVHIVLCCGAKRVLFTYKLSERWCHIINLYLFTKFHTSKH